MSAIKNYADQTGSKLIFYSLLYGAIPLEFYAFLTSFNQTFNSKWNQEEVYGRNDPIGTFQGTSRTLSLGWDVPAANWKEGQRNMSNIRELTFRLYPMYSSSREALGDSGFVAGSNALTLSKPPLMRLRYANLIADAAGKEQGLLGFVSNLGITPVLDMGMFTKDGRLIPKVFSLTLDYTVVHEHDMDSFNLAEIGFPFGGGSSDDDPFGGIT